MKIDNRYERQIALPEIGIEGQNRLANARVLLIGVGGLGSPVALYLTAAGIGTLHLVDDDRVSLSNLQRQVIYSEADLGQLKASCAALHLQALNSQISVVAHTERITRENVDRFVHNMDVVIDACDNFATRYIVSDACLRAHIPYVYGAIRGFEGQVSILCTGSTPRTYRDLYPDEEAMLTLITDSRVIGVTPAVVGSVQASEALKLLLGYGEPLIGRLWTIDLRTLQTYIISF